MPPSFDPARHPRDKRGRFTKSRTVLASAKDKRAVKDITAGFKPAQAGDGKAHAAKIAAPEQQKPARDFAVDAREINADLRAGHQDVAGVRPMDDAMRPLPADVILHRSVPAGQFGGLDVTALQGMKVRDAGYAATQLDPAQAGQGDVRMFIAAPKGSRAVVNADTGEVYLDRDSEMVVSRVEPNQGGGHDMYLTVLPKTAGTGKTAVADNSTGANKPKGADEFRAGLMKQKVPDLQAQMRERGLKPGRKRKSELVDALVADEMGNDSKPAPTSPPATGADALAAPTLNREATPRQAAYTPEIASAVYAYGGGDYAATNAVLRGTTLPYGYSPQDVQPVIDGLDAAMTASRLDRDAQVWRGVTNAQPMFGDRLAGDLTGLVWREDAFVSTSAVDTRASQFASGSSGLLMRIIAPAETPAVTVSGLDTEAEVLLGRGHEFEVAADHGVVGGKRRIDVRVRPKVGGGGG